jgi:hypothetical protein
MQARQGKTMKHIGGWLIAVGVLVVIGGFFLPTSVETYSTSSYLPDSVVNIGRLQTQMIVIQSGFVFFLGGIFLMALGFIAARAERLWIEASPFPEGLHEGLHEALGGEAPPTKFEILNRHAIMAYGIKRAAEGAGYVWQETNYWSLTDGIRAARKDRGNLA